MYVYIYSQPKHMHGMHLESPRTHWQDTHEIQMIVNNEYTQVVWPHKITCHVGCFEDVEDSPGAAVCLCCMRLVPSSGGVERASEAVVVDNLYRGQSAEGIASTDWASHEHAFFNPRVDYGRSPVCTRLHTHKTAAFQWWSMYLLSASSNHLIWHLLWNDDTQLSSGLWLL